jgi:hypothetical protein
MWHVTILWRDYNLFFQGVGSDFNGAGLADISRIFIGTHLPLFISPSTKKAPNPRGFEAFGAELGRTGVASCISSLFTDGFECEQAGYV